MKLDSVIAQMHEHISDAVLICEADPADAPGPRIVWCNKAYVELSGYAVDEVIGGVPLVLQDAETRAETLDEIRAAFETKQSVRRTVQAHRKDGSSYWSDVNICPLGDEDGRLKYWIAVHRDVSEQVEQEQALREARIEVEAHAQRAKLATSGGRIGVWEFDTESEDLSWDDTTFQLYGVDKADFKGTYQDWRECVHPDDLEAAEEALQRSVEAQGDFEAEFRVLHPKRGVRHIVGRASIVPQPDGRTIMLGLNWDVTEQRVAAAKLEEASERLALATSSARMGIWEYEVESQKLIWDEQMFELYGLPDTGPVVPYETWESTLEPADIERAQLLMADLHATGKSFEWTFQINRKGKARHIRSHASIKYGRTTRIIGINWDVTEQVRAAEKEAAANRLKTEFLATVSHEVRTPLHGVLGMAQLLENSELDETQRRYLNTLTASGETLLALINDILDVTQIETGLMVLHKEWGLPDRLLCDTVNGLAPLAEKKELDFQFISSWPGTVEVSLDFSRVKQIVTNLVGNAIKFTESGHVYARLCRHHSGGLVITVEDSGIGLSKADQEKIFDRFVQADGSIQRRFGGSGLGLSVVSELVELMNGSIEVTSKPGKGSMFKVILPAEARLAKIAVPKADQRPGLEPDISLGEGRRALVVDDVHTNRIVCSALLKSLGFEVVEADGGEAALAALEKNTCDIIFMDLHMPGMAGDACVQQIRASEGLHALVPIIMLTADVSGDARKRTQACGADDICSKPFAMDKVRSIIGRYLPIRSEADSKAG